MCLKLAFNKYKLQNQSTLWHLFIFCSNYWDLCYCFIWEICFILYHWQNRIGARSVLHIDLFKQIWFPKEAALCVYSYPLPWGQNCMICPVKSKLEMERQEEKVIPGLRGSSSISVKPCNHWLSVCYCSCMFKGDGQYTIEKGHKLIKRHGSTVEVCDLPQVSAPPSWLTAPICSTAL